MLLNSSEPPLTLMRIQPTLSEVSPYVPGMLAAVLFQSLVYAALPKPKACGFILVPGAGFRAAKP